MAAAAAPAPAPAGPTGETHREDARKKDVRMANIEAAKAVADAVRTSLGPRGLDKMIQLASGEVVITNDGATILDKLDVIQPAAKMLVELAKAQDAAAGDGTTSVTVICGALLKACQGLLGKGLHPTSISDGFGKACEKACEVVQGMSMPVDLGDREQLVKSALTSLSSKVVSQYGGLLGPMTVDCVMRILDPERPDNVDLNDINIVKKAGGVIDESELFEGMILNHRAVTKAGGLTRVQNAKVGLIQFCLSPPKTDMENSIVVSNYQQMDRILKEERNYILSHVKKIKASGCNVVLIQKQILRDAVTDMALHYLSKAKIMCVKDIERDEIEFISKTLNCRPVAHVDHMKPEMLGQGRTASVLLRGSNKMVLEEVERSLHDALCVIRCLVQKRYMVPGGSSPEVEVSRQLGQWSKTLLGVESFCVRAFAEALEVVPYTLAENAGLNPIQIVTELRNHHAKGDVNRPVPGHGVRPHDPQDRRHRSLHPRRERRP